MDLAFETSSTCDARTDALSLLHISDAALDLVPAALYVCDRDGLILKCNRRSIDLWGRRPKFSDAAERFCGSYRLYRVDGRSLPRAECPMVDVLQSGESVREQELVIERPDGSRIVALVNIEALRDDNGDIIGAISCFTDTTELHQAREAAAEGENRTRRILEALPVAVYTTDAVGQISYYNTAAAKLAGRKPTLGSDEWCVTWKLYWPDGTPLPHDQCPMALALKERKPNGGMEAVAERPDGTRVPFLPYPTPLFDGSGNLTGAVNVLVDITERKESEQARRRNEAWLRGQKEAFQAAMDGAPLERSLDILIRTAIEQADGERRCAFYIADPQGRALHHVTGMVDSYAKAVDGFPISPESLACGLAVATGEPVITPDVCEEPLWKPWRWLAQEHDFRGCWSFPVETGSGKMVGSFAMYFREPREPSTADRELAKALADTAGIIISQYQEGEARGVAEKALRLSERRLSAELEASRKLQSISTQLIHERDTTALYEKIIDAAVSIMGSDFGSMQMFHPERGEKGELQLLAFRGFDPETTKFWEWVRVDSGCTCGQAMRTGRRAIAANVETCEFMAGTPDRTAYLEAGMLAAQSTPLISRTGRLLGMISTHWRKPHSPTEGELRRFDVLARQAADLIERATADATLLSSEKRLAQQVADMHRLYEFSRRLLEQDDLEVVMHEVLVAVAELLAVKKGSIQLCDSSRGGLRLISTVGFDREFVEKFQFVEFSGFTTCAAALNRRERVIVEDLATDSAFAEFARVAAPYGIRAAQSTPLLDRSGAVSAMLTTYFDLPYHPSQRELRLMDLYLQLAAHHIERKQAERDLRRSEERFRAFVTATSDAVYRMNGDWRELRHLDGKAFIADTHEPSRNWLDRYIHPDDQPLLMETIDAAIRTKSTFELEHRVLRLDGTLVGRSRAQFRSWMSTAMWLNGLAPQVT